MHIPDLVYRIIAIAVFVSCGRTLWRGLAERKIRYFNSQLLSWSTFIAHRDATPIQYWIQIGFQVMFIIASLVVAIFGWWRPAP